jgi:hypothetical protein
MSNYLPEYCAARDAMLELALKVIEGSVTYRDRINLFRWRRKVRAMARCLDSNSYEHLDCMFLLCRSDSTACEQEEFFISNGFKWATL